MQQESPLSGIDTLGAATGTNKTTARRKEERSLFHLHCAGLLVVFVLKISKHQFRAIVTRQINFTEKT